MMSSRGKLMNNPESDESSEISEELSDGKRNMVVGGLWCLGGIAVTIGTYALASGGGTYTVAWGAILFGLFQFIKGVIQAERYKELAPLPENPRPDTGDRNFYVPSTTDSSESGLPWRKIVFSTWFVLIVVVVIWQLVQR